MSKRIPVSFIVRDKGGPAGGKHLQGDAPDFEWERFKNTGNAEEFVKKAYFAAVKKIIRDLDQNKAPTVATDLSSMEAVIARSLFFTKEEIGEWIRTRDWSKATGFKDTANAIALLEKHAATLAAHRNPFAEDVAHKLATNAVAAVADKPDAVAEHLYSVLSRPNAIQEL